MSLEVNMIGPKFAVANHYEASHEHDAFSTVKIICENGGEFRLFTDRDTAEGIAAVINRAQSVEAAE